MKDHYYGFVLANNGYLDDVGYNTVAGHNKWEGSYGYSKTFSDKSDGSQCTLYTENQGGNGNLDPQILNIHATFGPNYYPFFKDNTGNTSIGHSCTTRTKVGKPKTNATPNYSKSGGNNWSSINPSFGKKTYMVHAADSALMYQNQMNFYRLAKDSALMASTLWKHFADSMKLTPMGRSLGLNATNTISTNNSNFDANIIIMNPIVEKFEQGLKLSATDLDKTRLMARECPYYDGIAVYQARYILNAFDERNIVNPCELVERVQSVIGQNNSKNNNKFIINQSFSIYPNPTKDVVTIDFKVNENEAVNIEIIDVMGKVQIKERLDASTFHTIQLKNMKTGIYFYRLIKNDAAIYNGKLIIE